MTVIDISVFKCIWFLDDIKVILEPACRLQRLVYDAHNFLQKLLSLNMQLVVFLLVFS